MPGLCSGTHRRARLPPGLMRNTPGMVMVLSARAQDATPAPAPGARPADPPAADAAPPAPAPDPGQSGPVASAPAEPAPANQQSPADSTPPADPAPADTVSGSPSSTPDADHAV